MDPTNAGVPKAHVPVKNLATGVIATDTTETGDYSVPYLKPGTYSISAQAQGFKTEVRSSIQFQVGLPTSPKLSIMNPCRAHPETV